MVSHTTFPPIKLISAICFHHEIKTSTDGGYLIFLARSYTVWLGLLGSQGKEVLQTISLAKVTLTPSVGVKACRDLISETG